jgi:cytochrome b561
VHKALNYLMAVLVFTHIGAALKHYFVDKDDILARMIPFLREKSR